MNVQLEDEFGRTVRFKGTELARDSTYAEGKPRWSEVVVWRTEAGSYVAWWKTVDERDDEPTYKVGVYTTAMELINSFAVVNHQTQQRNHSRFARAVLADISENDAAVSAEWMTLHIA